MIFRPSKNKTYLSLVMLVTPILLLAQELTPPIKQYTTVDYEGGSQNWDVEIDQDGMIYAANHQGLLRYDGINWDLFKVNDGAIVRSVFPHEQRVYIGAYEEFGFWSSNDTGEMEYTSLLPLLQAYDLKNEEFWEIIEFNDAIYFRSFAAIYRYDKSQETIEQIKAINSNHLMVFEGQLLVAVADQGLFFLKEDGELTPLSEQTSLQGRRVVDAEVYGDSLFIGTRNEIFLFDGKQVKPYGQEELTNHIVQSEINHLLVGRDDQLLIGTVKNGLVHHHLSSGKTMTYNRRSGLQNNTILAMDFKDGKLWLALDNGIDQVNLDSPIHFFTDSDGELGAAYDVAHFKDAFYIASNTGTYRLTQDGLTMVEGSRGHNWNLEVLDNTLYSNHNTGTYKMVGEQFVPVDERTGSFQILRKPGIEDRLFIGNYTGISVYTPGEEELRQLEGVNFPVRKLLFENPSTIWAEHAYEGVFRIRLEDQEIKVQSIEDGAPNGKFKSKIFHFNNAVSVLRNKEWYRYNSIRDSLEIFEELHGYYDHELLTEDELGYWFVDHTTNAIEFTDFRDIQFSISAQELDNRLVKGNEKMNRIADSAYIITLKDGFARIDLDRLIQTREARTIEQPRILAITDAESTYVLSENPVIPYKNARSLDIRVGLPDSDDLQLFYELTGKENLRGEVSDGHLKFQRLPAGDYELSLTALGPDGVSSDTSALNFSVESPWYLSLEMKSFYLLLVAAVLVVIRWVNRKKLNKHRAVTEQQLQQEHQKRMNALEKERLEKEVMLKRKELANTTMIAAKKNEVLMEIQTELKKNKENFSNQYRLKHLMNKVNQAIQNKDEWQVFETNFQEVHEDFFKDLLEHFPGLSSKDLKLCSYLRMNLTTKEIAPLMGKSVRGVEVHRYRLRKKLDLPKDENLVNFLIRSF